MFFSVLILSGALSAAEPESGTKVHIAPSLEQQLVVGKVSPDHSKARPDVVSVPSQPPLTARIVDGSVVVSHGPLEAAEKSQNPEQDQ